jgi:hypothetical protein
METVFLSCKSAEKPFPLRAHDGKGTRVIFYDTAIFMIRLKSPGFLKLTILNKLPPACQENRASVTIQ